MICFSIERSQVTRYGPGLTIKSAQSPFFPGKLPDEMVGPKPHSVLREQFKPMPDPDLEISGGGGGNTDPEIRGGGARSWAPGLG